jgi:hypothetical protein
MVAVDYLDASVFIVFTLFGAATPPIAADLARILKFRWI